MCLKCTITFPFGLQPYNQFNFFVTGVFRYKSGMNVHWSLMGSSGVF